MQTLRCLRRSLLTLVLLVLAGCGQRLDYETTVDLDEGQVQSLSIDAPKREQKASVTATSSTAPINVYVVLDKNKEAAKQALLDRRQPAEALARQVKTQDATLEATIPANTRFAVLLGGASKHTQVKVKITGR